MTETTSPPTTSCAPPDDITGVLAELAANAVPPAAAGKSPASQSALTIANLAEDLAAAADLACRECELARQALFKAAAEIARLRREHAELQAAHGRPAGETPLIAAARAAAVVALGDDAAKADWLRSRGWIRLSHGWKTAEGGGIYPPHLAVAEQARRDAAPVRHLVG